MLLEYGPRLEKCQGALGHVNGICGCVEAQGRGSLTVVSYVKEA